MLGKQRQQQLLLLRLECLVAAWTQVHIGKVCITAAGESGGCASLLHEPYMRVACEVHGGEMNIKVKRRKVYV